MHKYCNINVSEYTNITTGRTRNAINSNLGPNRVRTSLFLTHFSIALLVYGHSSLHSPKLKLSLPSKTVYLTTSLTNLSLILILLEFKHGKQSALIVAQLIS